MGCLLFFRCGKLEEMLNLIEAYTKLSSSHIEGIEVISSRFQLLVSGMKKKPYDLLDQRKSDFDGDFEEFLRLTRDILVSHKFSLWIAGVANSSYSVPL